MKKLPPVLVFTVLRLLAFLVPFGIMMLFPVFRDLYWLAAVFAALIGLSLSVIFFRKPLAAVSAQVERRRRTSTVIRDEDVEDAAADDIASPVAPASPEDQPTNAQKRNPA